MNELLKQQSLQKKQQKKWKKKEISNWINKEIFAAKRTDGGDRCCVRSVGRTNVTIDW